MEIKIKYKKHISLFFLVLLSVNLITLTYAQNDYETIEYNTDIVKDVLLQNVDSVFECNGVNIPETILTLKFYLNNSLLFSQNVNTDLNGVWSYQRSLLNVPFGIYRLETISNNSTIINHFTYVDLSNWNSVNFPLSTVLNNISYTLFSNRTLSCYLNTHPDDIIKFTFPRLDKFEGLNQESYVNSMCYRLHLEKTDVFDANILLIKTHKGLKILIEGTQDKPRIFTFKINAKRLKTFKRHLKSGNLIFDFSDLETEGLSFEYDRERRELNIIALTSFFLDPVIFSDGFESGDVSNWDTLFSTDGSYSVQTNYVINGTYTLNVTNNGVNSYCTAGVRKDIAQQTEIYTRVFVNISDVIEFGSSPSTAPSFIYFWGTANSIQAYAQIWGDNTQDYWRVQYRSGNSWVRTDYATGERLSNNVFFVEIYFKVDNIDGNCTLWVNGTRLLTASGFDSNNRGNVDAVFVGFRGNNANTKSIHFIDDVVVNDTYIGYTPIVNRNITFYFTNFGKFLINNSTIGNGTSVLYPNGTQLELTALVNSSYGWYNFTYNNDTYTFDTSLNNPEKTIYITSDGNITCYFFNATALGNGNGDVILMTVFIPDNALLILDIFFIILAIVGLKVGFVGLISFVLSLLVLTPTAFTTTEPTILYLSVGTILVTGILLIISFASRWRD